MMTVKQLIEKLSSLPSDAVLVSCETGDYFSPSFKHIEATSDEEAYVTNDRKGHLSVVEVW